jgi:hypothetical protein
MSNIILYSFMNLLPESIEFWRIPSVYVLREPYEFIRLLSEVYLIEYLTFCKLMESSTRCSIDFILKLTIARTYLHSCYEECIEYIGELYEMVFYVRHTPILFIESFFESNRFFGFSLNYTLNLS